MAVTAQEVQILDELYTQRKANWPVDERHERYYKLIHTLIQLGMAIPPSMRDFVVMANWARVVVRTISSRQRVRGLFLPGESKADEQLLDIWNDNNMASQMKMMRKDRYIFGRAFISAGYRERGSKAPLLRVESPREIEAKVNNRTRTMEAAARFYAPAPAGTNMSSMRQLLPNDPTHITLYMPDYTKQFTMERGRWYQTGSSQVHRLGAVPMVMDLNEQMSGPVAGESELTDILPLMDAAARSLTNLQFAQEAHGIPRMWMSGVDKKDFIDPTTGEMIPMFEAYFDAIHMLKETGARVGQLTAADLKNFETALTIYGKQAATAYGFPARYFGIETSIPATEGAVIADEIQLVQSVEDKNEDEATTVGWVGGLAYRLATGEWVEGNRIRADHFDPATPTIAQREDALMKRRSQGVLSREGYWDELGWSEERKQRERDYLEKEARLDRSFLENQISGV
jgi:hypothetical protein